jgi:hypothetical protein
MPFNAAGGISAALGFQRGRDEQTDRERSAEDRTQLGKDRAFQEEARNQQRADWARKDTLRSEIAAIPTTETVNLKNAAAPQVDDDGNPSGASLDANVTRDIPLDVQLRQAAAAKRKAGDMEGWLKDHQAADQHMYTRSAQQFQSLIASAPSLTGGQLAEQAAGIWNNSNMPFKVGNVTYDEGSGQIQVGITNRDGTSGTRTYKNKDEFLVGLQSMADPATFAKLQQTRAETAAKVQEEIAKNPHTILPAGSVAVNRRTGHVDARNDNKLEFTGRYNPDGTPEMLPVRLGGGGAGAGAGGARGKGPTGDPVQDSKSALADAIKDTEDKLTIDQKAYAEEHVARIATQNPTIPPAIAARVAIEVARDPSKLKPAIDPNTGSVDIIANTGAATGRIVFQRGVANHMNALEQLPLEYLGIPKDKLASMSPEEQRNTRRAAMRSMTETMLQQRPPAEAEALRAAASDQSGVKRGALETSIRDQAAKVLAEQVAGKPPEQAAEVERRINAARDAKIKALGNSLDLVHSYIPAPAAAKPPAERKPFTAGGLSAASSYRPPDGPARPSQGRRPSLEQTRAAQAASQAEQDRRAAETEATFERDAKSMPPLELVRKYDAIRGSLPASVAAKLKTFEQQI